MQSLNADAGRISAGQHSCSSCGCSPMLRCCTLGRAERAAQCGQRPLEHDPTLGSIDAPRSSTAPCTSISVAGSAREHRAGNSGRRRVGCARIACALQRTLHIQPYLVRCGPAPSWLLERRADRASVRGAATRCDSRPQRSASRGDGLCSLLLRHPCNSIGPSPCTSPTEPARFSRPRPSKREHS